MLQFFQADLYCYKHSILMNLRAPFSFASIRNGTNDYSLLHKAIQFINSSSLLSTCLLKLSVHFKNTIAYPLLHHIVLQGFYNITIPIEILSLSIIFNNMVLNLPAACLKQVHFFYLFFLILNPEINAAMGDDDVQLLIFN